MKKKFWVLFTVIVMIFSFIATAQATDVTLGGTLYFRFEDSAEGVNNLSRVDFFRINVATRKSFGKADAYMEIQTQTYIPDAGSTNKYWNIYNYGYNYNFSNTLGTGVLYHTEGVTLADGWLGADWDWLNVRAFESQPVVKFVAQPFSGLSAGLYLESEKMEYILKGEYLAPKFRAGAGYSNAENLVGLDQSEIDHYYNVYAEVYPAPGVKVYGDYLADGKFLFDAVMAFAPVTLSVLYSNEDKVQFGHEVFAADTADISVDYAFSRETSVTGGAVYDTAGAELAAVYGRYNFRPGYAGIKQDFTLSETHICGGYNIDGSNTLEGDYNINTGAWWIAMVVGLW